MTNHYINTENNRLLKKLRNEGELKTEVKEIKEGELILTFMLIFFSSATT